MNQSERIAALEEALREQWEYNHFEHCGRDLIHLKGECMWPLPTILGGNPQEYRTYQDAGSTWTRPEVSPLEPRSIVIGEIKF